MEDDFEKSLRLARETREKAKAAGLKMGRPQDLGMFFDMNTPEGAKAASTPIILPPAASCDYAAVNDYLFSTIAEREKAVAPWQDPVAIGMTISEIEWRIGDLLRSRGINAQFWKNRNYVHDLVAAELVKTGDAVAIARHNADRKTDEDNLGPMAKQEREATAIALHAAWDGVPTPEPDKPKSFTIERGDSKQAEKGASDYAASLQKTKPTILSR